MHGPKEKKKYETKDEGARLNDWLKPGMTSHAALNLAGVCQLSNGPAAVFADAHL